jgi:Fe-S cluster assembly protein SufD
MAPSQAAISEASLDKFLAVRDEPSWLVERRRAAMTSFQSAGWPSLRDEEWRRTDVRALKLGGFDLVPSAAPSSEAVSAFAPAFDQMAESYGTGLLHLDGHAAREVRPAPLPDGVIFTTLAQAVKDHPELLKEHLLTRAVRPDEDVFSAYHAAFWSSGVLLYVPKGVKLEAPLFHLMGLSAAGSVDFNHTLVILEEGAEATLVQESAGRDRADAPALHAGAIELIVGPRARLRFVNIQNWDRGTWHFSRERAILDRDATIQWTVGGLGSRLAKVNQEVKLAGEGAKAQVNGVMFTTGRQNLTYLTRQDHAAPHTTSDLLYKAGLADSSRVVWKGMIRVEPDAQKTNAYQKNDNLMMSDEARSDSIPGLEIEANDVRCTHGATAGRVDEEMIFYLRSRGIKRDEAVRLIIEGFFANVYDRISVEPVRETLRQAVADKLEI